AKAYELGDISRVYPISRGLSIAIVTMVSVVVLEEEISAFGLLGIATIGLGIIALSYKENTETWSAGLHVAILCFIAGASVAMYSILDAIGVRVSAGDLTLRSIATFAAWLFVLDGLGMMMFSVIYRGGIREIEFFVQTQQLIAGGRAPKLRGRRTLDMLAAFSDAGWIEQLTAQRLSTAYRFLRRTEHALQMINDEQTHTMPTSDDGLMRVAALCGFDTLEAFSNQLIGELETVQGHYAELFEQEPGLDSASGSLV
ncbi:unnamed protein product, partial [marine sediment metagenome]